MAAWADVPAELRQTILNMADRVVAEEKADKFADIHDELTDFRLKVGLHNNIRLTIYNASYYFDNNDILELWYLNRDPDHKQQIELQIKAKALGLLRRFHAFRPRVPTFRLGNVLVQIPDERAEGTLKQIIGDEYFTALRRYRMGIYPPDYVFMAETAAAT